ncbi:WD repeat protein 19 [Thecamonas trahens ATCC 50062]|uniref:WD repeat protein 19 n=1 Tax=Thecamonas trahens ATCC 50062 TaxID=461836 RepID=A0A0L0DV42_THETB|nr:WD repeat protein 19 [Thecamonas trahens ATCC 50062]KNC55403.1 WD repeat protein 19 [Thecamonas trahens ATCC 50062]|eukprot:XP_013752942.1 WD repeat protein 19 [Thecamonas trahens ATCC 50062]
MVASAGPNSSVYVTDRHGSRLGAFHVSGAVVAMAFDADSETLAVISDGSRAIKFWNSNTRSTSELETKMKGLSFMTWAAAGALLAVGTVKGNLLLVDRIKGRLVPIVGKHTKTITHGAWSTDGVLALAAEDRQVTISSPRGDTVDSMMFKSPPRLLAFGARKAGTGSASASAATALSTQPTLSLVISDAVVVLQDVELHAGAVGTPTELTFSSAYGPIAAYAWLADGYLGVGFERGHFVVVSTHANERDSEVFSEQLHSSSLVDVAYCEATREVATAGDDAIVVISLASWSVTHTISLPELTGCLRSLSWAPNGQLLTVATNRGDVITHLTQVPVIGAAHGTLLASLASLREIALIQTHKESGLPTPVARASDLPPDALFLPGPRLAVDHEPALLALGPRHLAAGSNNTLRYYDWAASPPALVMERDYVTTIERVVLNASHAAVLAGRRISIHSLLSPNAPVLSIPERGDANVTCVALSEQFLAYGTADGGIHVALLGADGVPASVAQYALPAGVTALYPNANGTRIFVRDDSGAGHVYNPVNDALVPVPHLPRVLSGVLWDQNVLDDLDAVQDWGVFVAYDADIAITYAYFPLTVQGATVEKVAVTHLPRGHVPMLLRSGSLVTLSASGTPAHVVLASHNALGADAAPLEAFEQNLALGRLSAAWRAAVALDNVEVWNELGSVALAQLDVELATQAYRQIGDAGMVLSLEGLADLEDRSLLAGYVAMFLPKVALDMRRDLLHWDAALQLATTLAPNALPGICKEYAQQLEFNGEYEAALNMFTRAAPGPPPSGTEPGAHTSACEAGMARCTLRLGDLSRGLQLVLGSNSPALCRDAGAILESMKQYSDAAVAYEAGKVYDKAVAMYLVTKSFDAAGKLMEHVKNPQLHLKYGKAMEALGKFKKAEAAYEAARDWVGVIRVNLDKLDNPSKVLALVRSTKSAEGAMLVAEHCRKVGDYASAIEFLLLADCREEAYNLADREGQMDTYASLIGNSGTRDEYAAVAKFYTAVGDSFRAGQFFARADDARAAVRSYLAANTEEALLEVINYVGKLRDDVLIHLVIDDLSGASGGEPKDPKYIYWLYSALGNFDKVADVAVRIAANEQELGNYREAHLILHDAATLLRSKDISVPHPLARALMLVHSYLLVKSLAKIDSSRVLGARMLVRVAASISKFPAHVVPILTSTVLECYKSGLKRSAFEYATMLMRPEYRTKLNDKYRKRIEAIVRRPDKSEPPEETSPCGVCDAPLANSDLDCPSCRSALPFCVMTGTHIVREGLCLCPHCAFGAHKSIVAKGLVANGGACPMCGNTSEPSEWQVLKMEEARSWVQEWVQ